MNRLMRQSVIGDGQTCHARLGHKFHWNPDIYVATEEAITGTAFHAICEAQAYKQRDGKDYNPEQVAMSAVMAEVNQADQVHWRTEKDGTVGDVDIIVARAQEMAEFYITKHWYADPEKFTIVAIEQRFELPWIDGWDASGTVDLVLMDQSGWLYILDYKGPRTKKRAGWERTRNNVQMAWYFQWIAQWFAKEYPEDFAEFGARPMKGIYEVISWGTGLAHRTYETSVSPTEMAYVLGLAEQYAQLVDQGPVGLYITNSTTHLCHYKWCDFWTVCDAGEKLNTQ